MLNPNYKIIGIDVITEEECIMCKGKGNRWYSIYHNDSELGECDHCKGTGKTNSRELISLKELKALLKTS